MRPTTRSAFRHKLDPGGSQVSSLVAPVALSSSHPRTVEKQASTRSSLRRKSEPRETIVASQLATPHRPPLSQTKDKEVKVDGSSPAEEVYLVTDTPRTLVKVEFPTLHNISQDSRDSVVSADPRTELFQHRDRTCEYSDFSVERIDPRQSCRGVVEMYSRGDGKDKCGNSGEYNSDWESEVENETLKAEPDADHSDGETTASREDDQNALRLCFKKEEMPLNNHEENGISSVIEIIENPPYKAENLGNYNNFSTDELNINSSETFLPPEAVKSGDNTETRDRNSEVVNFKSIESPKSDNNFDVRSDSQEYVLASEDACGENDSQNMHMCDPSCEINGKCVIKAHDRLYGPSYVTLSPKYLNILSSVPDKNDHGDASKNVNLSSVSNDKNNWEPDQDKNKCISGISTMSFSENGFTIDAVNESITLTDSDCEVDDRPWWNVYESKYTTQLKGPPPVNSDGGARSPPFKLPGQPFSPPPQPYSPPCQPYSPPRQPYCTKCSPPPYLIEDLLGELSSVFYYFYTDFFCLCKSKSKLFSNKSDPFKKLITFVSILNALNPAFIVAIIVFLIYGRGAYLIDDYKYKLKSAAADKRERRVKKDNATLKNEMNDPFVPLEENNAFSLVQGEDTSYERVVNLDKVVVGTKRKARVSDGGASSKENISENNNGAKKRRKRVKLIDELIEGTPWQRLMRLDTDTGTGEDREWNPGDEACITDDNEPAPRLSPDETITKRKLSCTRRIRNVIKCNIKANNLTRDNDSSVSTSHSFPGFNPIEIPATENVIDIWKESVNPLIDYCSDFKGFTGVSRKKSSKKKNIFLDWMEGTLKSNGFVT